MNILIIGCGGIGQAIAKAFIQENHTVTIFGRTQPKLTATWQAVDMLDEAEVRAAVATLPTTPDIVINTIGMLHQDDKQPEKALKQLTEDWLLTSMQVNVLPTVWLTQALSERMHRQSQLKMIGFSARVGSVSDNELGGWHSYRMSKCALNMLIKNVSIEWQHRFPKSAIYGYHPGTVATSLSAPFQANIPKAQLFTPEQAALYCLAVLKQLAHEQSGNLYDWQGHIVPF